MKKQIKHTYNFIDLTGKRFGRLIIICWERASEDWRNIWKCECDCGKIKYVATKFLRNGNVKSCGCWQKEMGSRNGKVVKTHGLSNTRFYHIWEGMIQRCTNQKTINYHDYGGRGITVCNRWLKFENFMADMYESYLWHVKEFGEKNTSIDRKNVDGGYHKLNCKWVTRVEQIRHRRISPVTENYDGHVYWRHRLQALINQILRNNTKASKIVEESFGCSVYDFRKHIESLFLPGMTWNNRGKGKHKWNLDHIIGCNNFDLSKEEDRKKCFNYKNLQPMWHEEHLKKSKKRKIQHEKI